MRDSKEGEEHLDEKKVEYMCAYNAGDITSLDIGGKRNI